MMTLEQFTHQIEKMENSGNSFDESINIKGCIAKTMRLCLSYPDIARQYQDMQPKAVMD